MSIALWAAYQLDDNTTVFNESDKYQMLEYIDELDYLCEKFQIASFSSLLGNADMMDDVLDNQDIELMEAMGVSENTDSTWVHPHEAITILDTLYSQLSTHPELLESPPEHVEELLEELKDCLDTAQTALEQCERFHLTLVS